eukprot:2740530-Rhodomonas_salina.1
MVYSIERVESEAVSVSRASREDLSAAKGEMLEDTQRAASARTQSNDREGSQEREGIDEWDAVDQQGEDLVLSSSGGVAFTPEAATERDKVCENEQAGSVLSRQETTGTGKVVHTATRAGLAPMTVWYVPSLKLQSTPRTRITAGLGETSTDPTSRQQNPTGGLIDRHVSVASDVQGSMDRDELREEYQQAAAAKAIETRRLRTRLGTPQGSASGGTSITDAVLLLSRRETAEGRTNSDTGGQALTRRPRRLRRHSSQFQMRSAALSPLSPLTVLHP